MLACDNAWPLQASQLVLHRHAATILPVLMHAPFQSASTSELCTLHQSSHAELASAGLEPSTG